MIEQTTTSQVPPTSPLPIRAEHDGGVLSAVIPYRNVPALIGYYLGVGALIPLVGLVLGPAAIVLGIVGIKHAKREPAAKGTVHAGAAIALGTLGLLINIGLIALVVLYRR